MGLLETARVEAGVVPLWPFHQLRLAASAQALGLPLPATLPTADDVAASAGAIQGIAAVRLTATEGEIRLEAREVHPSGEGWRACSIPEPRDPDPLWGHKTTLRAAHTAASALARAQGCQEALWSDGRGQLTEGTITNLFVAMGGNLYTPRATGSNLLPGIARGRLLTAGTIAGNPVREASLTIADMVAADEVFLTNAVRGAIPLLFVDGQRLRRGGLWQAAIASIFPVT